VSYEKTQYKSFVFGDFRLSDEKKVLYRGQAEIHLAGHPFEVLRYLIENRERVVGRDELLDKFWDGHDVYDDALRKCVGTIRQALDDRAKPPRFIETRYGGGYRFICEASESPSNDGVLETPEDTPWYKRYVFLSGAAVTCLFLLSLGFYVSLPNNAKASGLSDNQPSRPQLVRSVAIMPLKNLTGDVANEYLSDGITESIISEISRIDEMRTISRSSTFSLKGKDTDPRVIGQKLDVEAFLEGSLRKKGETLSVDVRLVSTEDGRVLWTSQNFERVVSSAYELQDTIACDLARELRAEFCGVVEKHNTGNPDAFQAYLRGRFQWNKRSGPGIEKSIEEYDRAIALDPTYALAFAGLSESYVQGIWHVPFIAKQVLPKARAAALKAIELDDTLAEAHTALANVYSLEWNWTEAAREIKRAIELNPHNERAHHVQAFYYLTVGRKEEAVAAIERARDLDPLNLMINNDLAMLLFCSGRNDAAFDQWRKTQELDPNFIMVYEHRAAANRVLGRDSESAEEYSKVLELQGKSPEKVIAYRKAALKNGPKQFYQQDLNKLLAAEKRGDAVSFVSIATYFTLLDRKEDAFKYLEKAYADHSGELLLLPADRQFEPLRSDPRFNSLIARMGLPGA